jgi:hypothetical protein
MVIKSLKMKLLSEPTVVQWLHGDLSFLDEQSKESEDKWGRSMLKKLRPDLKLDKQWTNRFGEYLCEDLYTLLGKRVSKPVKKHHFQPDLETEDCIIEVKTQTFFTSGTAGEKILGVPFKYAEIPILYSKPLKIVCLGGAEKLSKEQYGNLPGEKCTPQRQKCIDFFKSVIGVEYVSFTNEYLIGSRIGGL